MPVTISNITRQVAISSGYFNLPSIKAISVDGDWYLYVAANAGNTAVGAKIVPYRWGAATPLVGGGSQITIQGSFALITEPWNGSNVVYHGGCIEHIGNGINDITNTAEDDAYFFAHLGALTATNAQNQPDDAFYWDRMYSTPDTANWDYYQYHLHQPTSYPAYDNARVVHGAGNYLRPTDRQYGYQIHTKIKVSNVTYQSVMARVHTPSIGGAHNSHNDVTMPSVSNKNYMMGGIIKGVSDRFHSFYLAADGAQWRVYNRTYLVTTGSFSAEVDLGQFDLADPTITLGATASTGSCHSYPVRASAGDVLGTRIYFPVIMNNASSGFDLEIWSFTSGDTIAGGSITRTVLLSGQTARPDCHMVTVGDKIYAAVSNINGGGVSFFESTGSTTWTEATNKIVTNNSANHIRVHGLKYNSADVKFYVLLSGTAAGTGTTYAGPGMYTFDLGAVFAGYEHLDYDKDNNAYLVRPALQAGHLRYKISDGTVSRSTLAEPQGIGTDIRVLSYTILDPNFFNKTEIAVGGDEYIYHGITLKDNRKFLAGRVKDLPYGKSLNGDLLFTLVDQNNVTKYHFGYGGIEGGEYGDDYVTAAYQSLVDPNKVWICGYTKSELVQKRDIKLHGYCRNLSDSPNLLQWNDLVKDTSGNIYLAGTNSDGYAILAKYDYNYELIWQKSLGSDNAVTGESIAIDASNNIYTIGSVGTDAVIMKINSTGSTVWSKVYGTALGTEVGKGIAIVKKSTTEYVVTAITSGTTTTFLVLNSTDGTIVEQNQVSNLVVNRVRAEPTATTGIFLFAGNNGSTAGRFGTGIVNDPTRMIQWSTTFGTQMNDMQLIARGANAEYIIVGKTSTSGTLLKVSVNSSLVVTKDWARSVATCELKAATVLDSKIYAVGAATAGGTAAMGMDEGVMVRFDTAGNNDWKNVFGHDMHESMNGIISDITGDNIISCGWSESHSSGRDAIVFRSERDGFGTGVYHLVGTAGVPYYYLKTTLTVSTDANSITNQSTTNNSAGSIVAINDIALNYTEGGALNRQFDGSYGSNGNFMGWVGYFDLKKAQEFLNSDEYRSNQAAGLQVNYASTDVIKFWQFAVAGDGSADDGNIFAYDLVEATNGKIYVIGQTSGDVAATHPGNSGVYNYILVEFDPTTEDLWYFQNPTEKDVETYAITQLGNGLLAYTGRTTADLGGTNFGGYDIILGLFDIATKTPSYYLIGSGLDDKGVGIHDLGNNELAIVYSSYGALGDQTNLGTEDVGIIKFNYSTDVWGSAYQTGTGSSDIFEQNGNPSVKLEDGRIALVFSTGGVYDETGTIYGYLDIGLGLFDFRTNKWFKTQIGSVTSDIASSVSSKGDRLLVSGHMTATFAEFGQGIYVEVDVQKGLGGLESSI